MKLLCDYDRLLRIVGHKEPYPEVLVVNPAGRVDPGGKAKRNRRCIDLMCLEPAYDLEGIDSFVRTNFQFFEPEFYKYAVFINKRNDIGDCANGHDIKHIPKPWLRIRFKITKLAKPLRQGHNEIKDDTDAGKLLERKFAIAPLRIDRSTSRGQFRRRFVMVGDHHIHTEFF